MNTTEGLSFLEIPLKVLIQTITSLNNISYTIFEEYSINKKYSERSSKIKINSKQGFSSGKKNIGDIRGDFYRKIFEGSA